MTIDPDVPAQRLLDEIVESVCEETPADVVMDLRVAIAVGDSMRVCPDSVDPDVWFEYRRRVGDSTMRRQLGAALHEYDILRRKR